MDVSIIQLLLTCALIGVVIFYLSKKTTSSQNTDGITRDILANLNQHQLQQVTQIIEEINKNSRYQSQTIFENLSKLEERFNSLQSQVNKTLTEELSKVQMLEVQNLSETKQTFTTQAQKQEIHFEKIKTDNQENLVKIQTSIQNQLAQNIQNLIELNKAELKNIQDTNKQNFDLLNRANQEKLGQIQGEIDKKLTENLAQNLKSFEDVTKNLGHLQSTAQRMIDSTGSIDKLNNIFERTSSKAFGNFGEKYLESLLVEHIPSSFQKQVQIPGSNDKIDFTVQVGDKRIGIDSKFPVTKYQDFIDAPQENKRATLTEYLRCVITMAQDISTKYYKDGFLETLFLYLPSDSMYNEVVNNEKTLEALQKLKVTPTSPSTVFPLIMLVRTYNFRANVNENAEKIIKGLTFIKKNILSFQEEFRKLGDKIRMAQQNYETADRNLLAVQNTVAALEYHGKEGEESQESLTETPKEEVLI